MFRCMMFSLFFCTNQLHSYSRIQVSPASFRWVVWICAPCNLLNHRSLNEREKCSIVFLQNVYQSINRHNQVSGWDWNTCMVLCIVSGKLCNAHCFWGQLCTPVFHWSPSCSYPYGWSRRWMHSIIAKVCVWGNDVPFLFRKISHSFQRTTYDRGFPFLHVTEKLIKMIQTPLRAFEVAIVPHKVPRSIIQRRFVSSKFLQSFQVDAGYFLRPPPVAVVTHVVTFVSPQTWGFVLHHHRLLLLPAVPSVPCK